VLTPDAGWQRIRDMQKVVAQQTAITHAVGCLLLHDRLELTLELLRQEDWPEFDEYEPLPPRS
jgi:hypothetical protein